MAWEAEYTHQFGEWWDALPADEQADITHYVKELQKRGPELSFPYSSGIRGSRYGSMRELRVQSSGKPIRILYAFDPRRTPILLVGGKKGGNKGFYDQLIRAADRLFEEHLAELESEREKEVLDAKHKTVFGTRGQDPGRSHGTGRPKK